MADFSRERNQECPSVHARFNSKRWRSRGVRAAADYFGGWLLAGSSEEVALFTSLPASVVELGPSS